MGAKLSGLEDLKVGKIPTWFIPANGDGHKRATHSNLTLKMACVLVDMFFVLAAWALTFAGRFLIHSDRAQLHLASRQHGLVLVIYVTILALSCYANGLYGEMRWRPALDEVFSIVRAQLLATVLLSSIVYLAGGKSVSRLLIVSSAVINIVTLSTWRTLWRRIVSGRFERGLGLRNVVIIGASHVGRAMANYFSTCPHLGYHFKGFLDSEVGGPGVLGPPEAFATIVRSHFIDIVFITSPLDRELVKAVALEARQLNISMKIVPDFYDGLAWNAPIEHLGGFPVQVIHRPPIPHVALLIKRAIDVVVSGVALLILAPVFLVIAIAVRMESPGPVLYRSLRVGKKGRTFLCYKFRTMVVNADAIKEELNHLNERDGVLFKIREDPRITRVGRVLRKYSLDELPQLWNVLKGEMSLVGPRPPIPSEVQMYSLDHLRRLDVTPGLTGLWQIMARHDPSFETYVALDVEYIETWSPVLDLKLLVKTIPAVLRGTGH